MKKRSQFGLLQERRFLPLFLTQMGGAFNDSVYKQAFIVLVTYGTLTSITIDSSLLANIAGGAFILPYVLFSAMSGGLADRVEKSWLIRRIKFVEIGIACLIPVALFTENLYVLIGVLFLLGLQSTFFGPLKFSILPQHLHESELIGGNAMVEMGTFVAVLTGTLLGGVLAGFDGVKLWVSVISIGTALVGFTASQFIPTAESPVEDKLPLNIIVETGRLIKIALERIDVFRSILGISWFWCIGVVYLTQIAALTKNHVYGGESVVTMILCIFSVSVALGSLACEFFSGRRVEIGLVPLGSLGISIFGADVYFALTALEPSTTLRTAAQLLFDTEGSVRVLIDLGLLGFFTGVYVVPLQAWIQTRTPLGKRARVIAANNVMNAVFQVTGICFAILWLTILDFSIPTLLLALAVINLFVALYIFTTVPLFAMRFLVWGIGHFMYRVRHIDLEKIPDKGAAILVSNHVSRLDAVLLAGACPRPIRFVMAKAIYDVPILNFIFRIARTIPIIEKDTDPEAYERAFKEIENGLNDGDLICIFPEGKLTPDGTIQQFQAGIDKILATTPVPVIPCAIQGLWGSRWSRSDFSTFAGPRRFWHPVTLIASDSIAPEEADSSGLFDRVAELRGAYP